MADQLQSIVQRMIDAGESEENIGAVIKQYKSSTPETVVAEARKQGAAGNIDAANDAFFQIPAEERKKRGLYAGPGGAPDTTTGGLLALGGAVAPWSGMIRSAASGVLKAAENPLIGGAVGAYTGYKNDGIPGAIRGGLYGALGSGTAGLARKGVGALTTIAAKGATAVPKAVEAIEMLPRSEEALTAGRAAGLSGRATQAMADQLKRDFLLRTLGNSRY